MSAWSDRLAADRHMEREQHRMDAVKAAVFDQQLGAQSLARERHACGSGSLSLRIDARQDAFEFTCACGAVVVVSGMEATAVPSST